MATETTVRLNVDLKLGFLSIEAPSVDELKAQMKAAGLPIGMLKDVWERGAYLGTEAVASSATDTPNPPTEQVAQTRAEPEPAPAPEPEPEPQFTETDVRKRIEKLVSLGAEGAKFAVTLMTDLEAFNEDKRPNVSALAPEKYGIAIEKSEAKIAEIEAAKATAGGVL